jgi:hypothetical protein
MTGTGKLTFAGQNINSPPYHAALAAETKYWFLDGFTSQQFVVDPQRLISTKSILKDWIISTVIRVESSDGTRKSMLTSVAALARLFDPRRGEQRLIFDEFPDSFFLAKLQKSTPINETQSPYMMELAIEFACTGPAYSNIESVETSEQVYAPQSFTVTSAGDSLVYPRWRYNATQAYSGGVGISNDTTGEYVGWSGNLAQNDMIDFVMDGEYGVPYTALKNGMPNIANVWGPAWPHLVPGENQITVSGPSSGTIEVRYRDRWLVGQQTIGTPTQIVLTASVMYPPLDTWYTLTAYLKTSSGEPISAPIIIYGYDKGVRYNVFNGITNENGQTTFSTQSITPAQRTFYAEFTGNEYYAPSTSEGLLMGTAAATMSGFAVSTTTPRTKAWLPMWGTLQWYDPREGAYHRIQNDPKPVSLWYSSPHISYVYVKTVMTDNSGAWSSGWTMGEAWIGGPWTLHADFAGDWVYSRSSSTPITIVVID